MKKILPLLLCATLAQYGCCIVHRTFAQSDVIDTHKPKFPAVECIPCNGLRNTNEHFSFVEILGTSGSYSAGLEVGHNFNNLRLYATASGSYWPYHSPTATFTGQFGMVGLNPNFFLRPEIGTGLSEWMVSSKADAKVPIHPSLKQTQVGTGNFLMGEFYGGLRFAFPQSSLNVILRLYHFSSFKTKAGSNWYPGIVLGCRF